MNKKALAKALELLKEQKPDTAMQTRQTKAGTIMSLSREFAHMLYVASGVRSRKKRHVKKAVKQMLHAILMAAVSREDIG